MCLLSIYLCDDPGEDEYQVIIASNRDEQLNRATKPACFWGDSGNCLGGLDAEAGTSGGTWLGISKRTGRFGALVNIGQKDRDMEKRSRGSLVTDYISSDVETAEYLDKINEEKQDYNGFHLVVMEKGGEKYKMHLLSATMQDSIKQLDPGVLVLGNSHYLKPWKKVPYAENKFAGLTEKYNSISSKDSLTKELYGYLNDKTGQYPDQTLHDQLGPTPGTVAMPNGTKLGPFVKPEWLSSIFVTNDLGYGTRTHTLILIDKHGNCEYQERTLDVKFPKPSTDWITSSWTFKIGES